MGSLAGLREVAVIAVAEEAAVAGVAGPVVDEMPVAVVVAGAAVVAIVVADDVAVVAASSVPTVAVVRKYGGPGATYAYCARCLA